MTAPLDGPSARVIVIDGTGSVLLFGIEDPHDSKPPLWITPGGWIELGASISEAAERELAEETRMVRSISPSRSIPLWDDLLLHPSTFCTSPTHPGTLVLMDNASAPVGRRVIVTGMPGSGKSTFSKALSARTGLPLIHLDLHYWKPGWVRPSDDEWRVMQHSLLAGEDWIADGNYHETLDLRLGRADTVVVLDTPWWVCAYRAFVRGVRRPVGTVMPDGCEDSLSQRLRDEWRAVWVNWRDRRREPQRERAIISEYGQHATLHALDSKRAARAFLAECGNDSSDIWRHSKAESWDIHPQ